MKYIYRFQSNSERKKKEKRKLFIILFPMLIIIMLGTKDISHAIQHHTSFSLKTLRPIIFQQSFRSTSNKYIEI